MGDATAIVEELYRSALPRLCSYGFFLTGSESEGEEIVQAAIVKTFSRRRGIADAASGEAYVRAAMRTLFLDETRRAGRWRRATRGQIARGDAALEDEVVGADAVAEAIRGLPPRVRVAVALRYLDDLTIAEAAHRMGVTEGAVKKYLHVARERLGPWWEAERDPEAAKVPVSARRARAGDRDE